MDILLAKFLGQVKVMDAFIDSKSKMINRIFFYCLSNTSQITTSAINHPVSCELAMMQEVLRQTGVSRINETFAKRKKQG